MDPDPFPRAMKQARPGGKGARRRWALRPGPTRAPQPLQIPRAQPDSPRPSLLPPSPTTPAAPPGQAWASPQHLPRPVAPPALRALPGAHSPPASAPGPAPASPRLRHRPARPGPPTPRHCPVPAGANRSNRARPRRPAAAVTSAGPQRRAPLPLPRGRLPMAAPPARLASRRLSPPLTTPPPASHNATPSA
ncbi:uncharacterized protein LOC133213495 [Neopsephotus bourkii]|uniref:uncharacterized protein LOC133213495 n=1 Tax=Neopsephotus bourkii TaxID=309878 RepID=UPI002AA4FC50|nr:uncharacterized protein LOC133213495 [Neopsephotus bourkii]